MSFQLTSKIPQLLDRIRTGAIQLVNKTALDVEVAAKTSMTEPKSGRVYPKGKGKTHQASAPGEAPAIDEKDLIKSFGIEETGEAARAVGVKDRKGVGLEFGTTDIAPRPFLQPAAESVRDDFEKGLKELVK